MPRILIVNGSYREDGITDQVVEVMAETLNAAGSDLERIDLRDHPIEFCLNCRECTQQPGVQPGSCVLKDTMPQLIDAIERSDAYILAAPTNFGSVTALFKRFMERLTVYAYWSWEMNGPEFRKKHAPRKKAILVSSCAAPGIMGHWIYHTRNQLKTTARTIGAQTVGTLFTGLVAKEPRYQLDNKVKMKARALASRLL